MVYGFAPTPPAHAPLRRNKATKADEFYQAWEPADPRRSSWRSATGTACIDYHIGTFILVLENNLKLVCSAAG